MMNATNGTNVIRRAGLAAMVMALSMIARDASAIERKEFIFGLIYTLHQSYIYETFHGLAGLGGTPP